MLDDQFAGTSDVFGAKLLTVTRQLFTYVDRLQIEHECVPGVQNLADDQLLGVFHEPDTLHCVGLRVEPGQVFFFEVVFYNRKVLIRVDILEDETHVNI